MCYAQKNVLLTNEISRKKCLFIKLLRSLASVLLVSPISSASLVKTALLSAVGRGGDTFFFFCITQKNKRKYHACAKFLKVDNSGVLPFTKKINYLFEKVFLGKLSNSLFNNVFGAGFALKASPSCSCY